MTQDDAETLRSVAQALAGATEAQEIARRAARAVTRLLDADTSVYFTVDESYESAVAFAGYHVPPTLRQHPNLTRIRLGDLPVFIGDAFERRTPGASRSDASQPLGDHPFIRALPISPMAVLYAPVMADSRLTGALVSYWWYERHAVTDRDIRLATAVARQAAEALAAMTDMGYRALFERSLAGMFRTRRDGRVMECNAAAARILGYDAPSEIIGRHAREFYMDVADRDRLLAEVHRTGAVANVELRMRRRDGSAVPVLVNVTMPAGRPVYEGQILDISDRLAAEAARREAAALRSVASLANGAAHSINNPLTVIRGTLELIVQRSEEKVALQRIAPALRAIEQISDIVRRMSQISRLELVENAPGDMTMLDIRESAPDPPDKARASERPPRGATPPGPSASGT